MFLAVLDALQERGGFLEETCMFPVYIFNYEAVGRYATLHPLDLCDSSTVLRSTYDDFLRVNSCARALPVCPRLRFPFVSARKVVSSQPLSTTRNVPVLDELSPSQRVLRPEHTVLISRAGTSSDGLEALVWVADAWGEEGFFVLGKEKEDDNWTVSTLCPEHHNEFFCRSPFAVYSCPGKLSPKKE
ncbi:MAG: hypothetical protein V2A73_20270 [Pseudomonadota bacterium]